MNLKIYFSGFFIICADGCVNLKMAYNSIQKRAEDMKHVFAKINKKIFKASEKLQSKNITFLTVICPLRTAKN